MSHPATGAEHWLRPMRSVEVHRVHQRADQDWALPTDLKILLSQWMNDTNFDFDFDQQAGRFFLTNRGDRTIGQSVTGEEC
jgi:hypothetical protein